MEKKQPLKVITLKKFCELRLDIPSYKFIIVKLKTGSAEIFGTVIGKSEYKFTNCSISIFTWHGCEIHILGDCHNYIQTWTKIGDIPYIKYISIHEHLEELRDKGKGPRVMVVGGKDCGKTSLCKLLFSYATRMKRKMCFVDLNVDIGVCSLPTSISCITSKEPYNINEKFFNLLPLVYFFGNEYVEENEELYEKNCSMLAKNVRSKLANDSSLQTGGLIVDAGNYKNTDLYVKIAIMFEIDNIFVIGGGRLHHDLNEVFKSEKDIIVKSVIKSDGVTSKMEKKKHMKMDFIKHYFYGLNNVLSPHSTSIKFDDFILVKIGGGLFAPTSALPIGTKSIVNKCNIHVKTPTVELTNSILGISNAESIEELLTENIYGFVHVIKVDLFKKELKVLTPSPRKIERRYFIWGKMKWIDQ
jgi:polyribonucleotide 5'-hydroxyl-kinase